MEYSALRGRSIFPFLWNLEDRVFVNEDTSPQRKQFYYHCTAETARKFMGRRFGTYSFELLPFSGARTGAFFHRDVDRRGGRKSFPSTVQLIDRKIIQRFGWPALLGIRLEPSISARVATRSGILYLDRHADRSQTAYGLCPGRMQVNHGPPHGLPLRQKRSLREAW